MTELSEAALGWDVVTNTTAVRAASASWRWEPFDAFVHTPQISLLHQLFELPLKVHYHLQSSALDILKFLKFVLKGRGFLEKISRPSLGAEMLAGEEPAKHC